MSHNAPETENHAHLLSRTRKFIKSLARVWEKYNIPSLTFKAGFWFFKDIFTTTSLLTFYITLKNVNCTD